MYAVTISRPAFFLRASAECGGSSLRTPKPARPAAEATSNARRREAADSAGRRTRKGRSLRYVATASFRSRDAQPRLEILHDFGCSFARCLQDDPRRRVRHEQGHKVPCLAGRDLANAAHNIDELRSGEPFGVGGYHDLRRRSGIAGRRLAAEPNPASPHRRDRPTLKTSVSADTGPSAGDAASG
jgi:hypothetical protein